MHQNTKRHLFVWSKLSLDEISKLCLAGPPKGFCLSLEAAFGLRFLMFPWQVNGVCPLRRRTKSWMNAARRHQQGAGDDWDLPTFWGCDVWSFTWLNLSSCAKFFFFKRTEIWVSQIDHGFFHVSKKHEIAQFRISWVSSVFFYTCTEIQSRDQPDKSQVMVV